MAILNGLPIDIEWSPVLRLNLCAVGQLASPLQAIWVGAHVMQQIHATPKSTMVKILYGEDDKVLVGLECWKYLHGCEFPCS